MLSQQLQQQILTRLGQLPGDICFYYQDLSDGSRLELSAQLPVVAASVIKLPVLVCAFEQAKQGKLDLQAKITLRQQDKLPSCGALKALHNGLEVTVEDLCVLMIILSDNTATNLLIRLLGMDAVNDCMRRLGLQTSTLRRLLFDSEASARGLENTVTAGEMAQLLERLYQGRLLDPETDARMRNTPVELDLDNPSFYWLFNRLAVMVEAHHDS